MTDTFDPGTDFSDVVDGLQSVTFRRAADGIELSVASALRRAVTQQEAEASNGVVTTHDVVWHLPDHQLTMPPVAGDEIDDTDGVTWIALSVKRSTNDTRWRCTCRALDIVAGPQQLVTVQQAVWSKGDAGAATATWQDSLTDVTARIQPDETEVLVENRRRSVRSTHLIHFRDPIAIDENTRVVGSDASVYHVVGTDRAERLDVLQRVHAVKSPWPLA
jgi:hypothetical protein